MLNGAELQRYPVLGLQVGQPRVSWFSRRDARPWQDVVWAHGELDPPRQIDRLVIQAAPPSKDAPEPEAPPVPPTPEEMYPVPSRYQVRFDEGRSIEVRPLDADQQAGRLARLRAWWTAKWHDEVAAVFHRDRDARAAAPRAESEGRRVALPVAAAGGSPGHSLEGPRASSGARGAELPKEVPMKKLIAVLALSGLVTVSLWAANKEDERVQTAGEVMQAILDIPEGIPQSILDKADCVIVMPSVVKFAIGFGGSYGRGVMTCRSNNFTGPWSAPAMMALEGGSFGLQLGGQATDFVLLVMNPTRRQRHPHRQGQAGRRPGRGRRSQGARRRGGDRRHDAGGDPELLALARPVRGHLARGIDAAGRRRRDQEPVRKRDPGREHRAEGRRRVRRPQPSCCSTR